MEFQYFSISRGGHSILETLRSEGVEDPSQYIGFYNLRNYDRINTSQTMDDAEREAGVSYEEARMGHDERFGDGSHGEGRGGEDHYNQYRRYQKGAAHVKDH